MVRAANVLGMVTGLSLAFGAATATAQTLDFSPVAVPVKDKQKRAIQATSEVVVGGERHPLGYHVIARSGDTIGTGVFGRLHGADGKPLVAADGSFHISSNSDFSSLMPVGDALYNITHFESVPGAMYLTEMSEDAGTGRLTPVNTANMDFSGVGGVWSPCAGSITPWGTHLGSEEYPPNARRVAEAKTFGDLPGDIRKMGHYFGIDDSDKSRPASDLRRVVNPYRYGYPIEVALRAEGRYSVVKHYAMGRHSLELAQVMPDRKTVYLSQDGNRVGFFLFVADRAGDLSADTLHAAIWRQDSAENGGSARLDWVGFDRRPDGGYTGWRAFAYHPFPGTFWPTNGSFGDVAIRLPDAFRRDAGGREDLAVYKTDLAIVEAAVRRRDVAIEPTDERRYGVDLNRDGILGEARIVAYDWAPLEGREMSYVGAASKEQARGEVHLAGGLFPEGSEFLHSVRYLDVADDGVVVMAARMKELRYARKRVWQSYADLEESALMETREALGQPDRPRVVHSDAEYGVSNGIGWTFQGFIEDAGGDLRPQSYEELVFCVGCHGGVGVTVDGIFSFPRRLGPDAFQGGWYHWSQRGLEGVAERRRSDGRGEYSVYLMRNGAGDEFRGNAEVMARFFAPDGSVRADRAAVLAEDIAQLLHPSRDRALALNKAYKAVVEEQSFDRGRDALPSPAAHVHRRLEPDQPTGIETVVDGP